MHDKRKKAPEGNDQRRPNLVDGCPLTAAQAAFGGKWKLIMIYWLADSPKHFADLRRQIPDISAKVLAEQLRELIADGIVDRRSSGRVPAPVIYSLTEYGKSVLPIIEVTRQWGSQHMRRCSAASQDAVAG